MGGRQRSASQSLSDSTINGGVKMGIITVGMSCRGRRGGLVVGRRTCDLGVASSRPGRDAAA